MKLVDILASELKHWPSTRTAAVGQSNSGSLHLNEEPRHGSEFFGWTTCKFTMAEDCQSAWVTRAEWQAAVDALNAPKVVAWDGVGLPPVGLDVEIKRGNCTWIDGDEWQIGKTATVMASFLNSRDIKMASVQFPGGHCECILARCLSPIRTAEQVAAEEREKGIQAIQDAYTYTVESCTHKILHSQAARLYDAGCRLQVVK